MPQIPLSDELLRERYDVYKQEGSISGAARRLRVARSTMQYTVRTAVRRGVAGDIQPVAPEGYLIGKITEQRDADGALVQSWRRLHPEADAIREWWDQLVAAAKEDITVLPLIQAPPLVDLGKLTLYPIADVHMGQHSWGEETGQSYDLKIARSQFVSHMSYLMAQTPPSQDALIVILGDYYHADNYNAETPNSGHKLDVDGRHTKVLMVGAEVIIWTVDMALQKHDKVYVKVMEGNHDPNSSQALLMAVYHRYHNNSRVVVITDPADMWAFEYGVTLLGFSHGHKVKAASMPGALAAIYPEAWGRTKERYCYSGHFHRSAKGPRGDEVAGAEWEIVPAFAAKDAWNRGMGFYAKRGLISITFDQAMGKVSTTHAVVR